MREGGRQGQMTVQTMVFAQQSKAEPNQTKPSWAELNRERESAQNISRKCCIELVHCRKYRNETKRMQITKTISSLALFLFYFLDCIILPSLATAATSTTVHLRLVLVCSFPCCVFQYNERKSHRNEREWIEWVSFHQYGQCAAKESSQYTSFGIHIRTHSRAHTQTHTENHSLNS